jgi:predicted membrane-bound spermidine synthase
VAAVARHIIPALVLLSGFCGISYEILYAKLLGNLLGNQFAISASVLLTFLSGIGLGTLCAHRFLRHLWIIETSIGAYAAAMVLAYPTIDRLLYAHLPGLGTSLAACALVAVVLLALPAFLVGCSVPLFAAYLATLRTTHVFSMTYGFYNFGAALTALAMEFALLRTVGLRAATLFLAGLNIVVGIGLLLLGRSVPAIVPAPRTERLRLRPLDLAALALASVASAVFQLLMIKLAECFLGPFNETFSLVLATVLLGLGLGALTVARLGLSLAGALIMALAGLALLVASVSVWTFLYAALYPAAGDSYPLQVVLKLGLVLVLMLVTAVGFGATVPALLREHRDVARESGQALFVSSMGNVAGFLLMAFVLHQRFEYGPVLVMVSALVVFALLAHLGPRRRAVWVGITLFALAVAGQRGLWSEALFYLGFDAFHSGEQLKKRKRTVSGDDEWYKGHRDLFAIIHRGGHPHFYINGYTSIALTNVPERIVGGLSVVLAPRTDRALVLGLGSGITAGTVALLFDEVDAVEINPVVVANQWRMARYNFNIERRRNVNIITDDGIHFVKTTPRRYSLILNTVTSPIYFSSSKLYTRDFFEEVKRKLAPGGVYTTWVDRKIGDRGINIILATLESSFSECWFSFLRSSYFLLACSDTPLQLRHLKRVNTQPELRRYATRKMLPLELMPYSILSVDAFKLRSGEAPINTVDFPVLEHQMARLVSTRVRLGAFHHLLRRRLKLKEVARRAAPALGWDPGAFAWWVALTVDYRSTMSKVLRAVTAREFGDVSEAVARLSRRSARRMGSLDAHYRYGYRLHKLGYHRAALPLLTVATALRPRAHRAHYYLAKCHQALRDLPAARKHLEAALAIKPDYEKAGLALEELKGDD